MVIRSELRWRPPHLLVAGIALFIYGWGFSVQIDKASLPEDSAVDGLVFPVRVEGMVVTDPGQLAFLAERWAVGDTVSLRDVGGATRRWTLEAAEGFPLLLVTAVSGLCFWSVAFFVLAPRMHEPAAPILFWILLLYGMAVMIGGIFCQRDWLTAGAFLGLIQISCLALLPPLFFLLTLRFPRRHPWLDRRWVMPLLWAAAAVLILWQAVVYGRYFAGPGPSRAAALIPAGMAADAFMLAVAGGGFHVLIRQIRSLDDPREVRRIRWLLWGFAVGTAPYLALRTLPQLVGLPAPLPAGADRVLELAVPFAFVCAVVREQFLDIDVVIRRSLLYSALAASVLLFMFVPTLLLTWSFGELRPNLHRLALLSGGLVAGLAFVPLRRSLGRIIDRHVLELRGDDPRFRERLADSLSTALTAAEVVSAVESAVARRLDCERIRLEVAAPDEARAADRYVARGASDTPEMEDGAMPAEWSGQGFVAAFSAPAGSGRSLWLLLGPRRTDRRYLKPELELLAETTRSAATAVDRLHLIAERAEEARARRQLDELNRMKSEFLAQVAHDLRTPVTSIDWSSRNLLDGLAGDLEDRQRQYLVSVRDAAAHLDQLVSNLVDLSRLESAEVELALDDVDPLPAVRRAVSALKPVADNDGVEIVDEVANAPRVRGNLEKLTEVLVNVLDNAVKYTPHGGRVCVSATTAEDGWEVSILDGGMGLDGAGDIFGRFSQGQPSPHSSRKGFGLGLFIVQQYMQMMGGAVHGETDVAGGARFRLRLPLASNMEGR